MELIEKRTKKQEPARRVLRRVVAGVLAFVMVASSALLLLTRVVEPENLSISQSAADSAYQALSGDSAYLSAPAAERVRMLLSRLGRQPQTAEEFEQIASMYVGRGNYAEAAMLYEQSVNATDASDTAALAGRELKLGSAYVLSGDLEHAETHYQLVLRYDSSSALAHLLLAQIYFEQQRYEESAAQIREYLRLVPNDTQNRVLLGNLYENMQQYDRALDEYMAAYQLTQSASDCMNVARAALLCGSFELGNRYLSIYLETNDDPDGSVHYLRGASLLGQEKYAAAQADMLEALELGYPDAADCYVQLTLCTYMQGDYARTLSYGKQAKALWETPSAECLQRMGLSAMQLGDYETSVGYLRQSVEADPALTDNHYYIATGCLLSGDYEAARSAYGDAIENGYLLQECYYNRAICSLQLADYEAALKDLLACLDAGEDEEIRTSALELLEQLGVKPPLDKE